jgi:hypothetical protein
MRQLPPPAKTILDFTFILDVRHMATVLHNIVNIRG